MKAAGILMGLTMAVGIATAACAGDFPTVPVELVVPFTPGGAPDTFARIIGPKLAEYWGQPVVVVNRPGAGGTVGAGAVARAAPDGYTLLVDSSAYVVGPALYKDLAYDPAKAFVDVAPLARQPNVLVVTPASGFKSVADLLAAAKAAPGQLKFGSSGVGSAPYYIGEKFRAAADIAVTHVPFPGGPEANIGTMAGQVSYWFPPVATALKDIQAGNLVALGVTSAQRSPILPEVPTLAESGIKDLESGEFYGVWAPAGIPAAVAEKLAQDIARAVAAPEVREQFAKLGAEPMSMNTEEFARFVRGEAQTAAQVLEAAGIKPR
jgi:tripartite-type tricarboxylate transporter receptor subunit TctC